MNECVSSLYELTDKMIKANSLENFANISIICISLINLIIVVYFSVKNINEQKQNRKNDFKMNWFKMLDISKRVKNLIEIIRKLNEDASNLKLSKKENVDEFQKMVASGIVDIEIKMLDEKEEISLVLKVLDEEEDTKICGLYSELYEECVLYFQSLVLEGNNRDIKHLNEKRDVIIAELYKICEKYI